MAWKLTTIRKNAKTKVDAVFALPLRAVLHTLADEFGGEDITLDAAREALLDNAHAKLTHSIGDTRGEHYTISINSNRFIHLWPVAAKAVA